MTDLDVLLYCRQAGVDARTMTTLTFALQDETGRVAAADADGQAGAERLH